MSSALPSPRAGKAAPAAFPLSLVAALLLAAATLATVSSAAAESPASFRVRTLLETRGAIEGFAQDGNRIAWANTSEPCRRLVQLRDLRTGRTWPLTGRKGPTCKDAGRLGGVQHLMSLAGRRALWAYVSVSNSAYHMSLYTASAGDAQERSVGGVTISGGLEDEDSSFRPVPMAGSGQTLVFADISNAEEGTPSGVYQVGRGATQMEASYYTFALAASGPLLALGRDIPEGCVCNWDPTWSPDDASIAFTAGGGSHFGREVRVIDAAGGAPRKMELGSTDFSLVGWSPAGTSVLLERDYGVYIAPSSGGKPRLLARGRGARWSPDGREVAFSAYQNGRDRLFVASVDGGARRTVGVGLDPRWAPDGRSLLARRSGFGEDGIYVVPLTGSPAQRIATEGGPYEWAPDGSLIAFWAGPGEGVYAVRPDGSGRRRLSANSAYHLAWSPDSRSLAASADARLVLIAADGSGERRLATGSYPAWSPDGSTIAFTSTEEGSEGELALIAADGANKRLLTSTTAAPARRLIELRRRNGAMVSSFEVTGATSAVALDGQRVALLSRVARALRLEVRDGKGRVLRRLNVHRTTSTAYLGLAGRWVVFHSRGAIRLLDWRSGRMTVLERIRFPVGLSVEGRRVAWAEQGGRRSRIRAVVLPR